MNRKPTALIQSSWILYLPSYPWATISLWWSSHSSSSKYYTWKKHPRGNHRICCHMIWDNAGCTLMICSMLSPRITGLIIWLCLHILQDSKQNTTWFVANLSCTTWFWKEKCFMTHFTCPNALVSRNQAIRIPTLRIMGSQCTESIPSIGESNVS